MDFTTHLWTSGQALSREETQSDKERNMDWQNYITWGWEMIEGGRESLKKWGKWGRNERRIEGTKEHKRMEREWGEERYERKMEKKEERKWGGSDEGTRGETDGRKEEGESGESESQLWYSGGSGVRSGAANALFKRCKFATTKNMGLKNMNILCSEPEPVHNHELVIAKHETSSRKRELI